MNDMKSRGSRKVAVLGPIPRDQVVTYAGERVEKYGCVMYTAVALSALLDAGDTIVPISHVRRRDEGPIKQILGSFPNIDTSGITSPADQGDVVELRYIDQNRRVERQTSFMNPILPADIDKVLDADVFVCVPITDYEVGQPTLRHIKEHSRATVVLDAHGPATTLTRSGERHPRVWADLDVWLPYIDILKMNLDEAGSAGSSSIASRWSTSWTRPVPATRSPGDWPTATSPTGITSWRASTGMRWALSAVPARI